MKITRERIKKVIKEEIQHYFREENIKSGNEFELAFKEANKHIMRGINLLSDAQYNIEYDSSSINTEPRQLEEEAKIEFIKEMVNSGMDANMAKAVIDRIYAMVDDSVGRHI